MEHLQKVSLAIHSSLTCPVCRSNRIEDVDVAIPWANSFATSLLDQIKKKKSLTSRQHEKVRELRSEIDQGVLFVWEKSPIMFLSAAMPCWQHGLEILETHGKRLQVQNWFESLSAEPSTPEIVDRVRVMLRESIFELTGFMAFATAEMFDHAIQKCCPIIDPRLFRLFMTALLKVQYWALSKNLVRDDCPPHLFDLRDKACRGDEDAVLVLRDAIMEGPNVVMKRSRI